MIARNAALLLGLTMLSSPAWALKEPAAGKEDHHIRTVAYNPNQVVRLYAAIGETLTVEFAPGSTITDVAVSDRADMKFSRTANVLWLKPTKEMDAQPISVRVQREDGKGELHIFQWEARKDDGNSPYYLVRFTYPADAAAAARAAFLKRQDGWRAAQAERALHQTNPQPTAASTINRNYTATGDTRLLPQQAAPAQQTAIREIK